MSNWNNICSSFKSMDSEKKAGTIQSQPLLQRAIKQLVKVHGWGGFIILGFGTLGIFTKTMNADYTRMESLYKMGI